MIRGSDTCSTAPQFRMLNESQVEQIHNAALTILQKIGVEIPHRRALALLGEAGAQIDGTRVRFPRRLVESALATTPSQVALYTRDGQPALELGTRSVYFGTYGTAPYVYDPINNQRRLSTKEDIAVASRVCDYLPNVDWSMPMGVPSDVPIPVADRHQFHAAIMNRRKPLIASAYTVGGLIDMVEMAAVIAGGLEELRERPFFGTPIDPSSPLRIGEEVVGKLLVMAERGLPIILNPMPMSGGTVPATLAGNLAVALSEDLSALILAQVTRAGTPIVMGGVLTLMDMGTGIYAYGAPELSLMMAAFADLTRFYRVPMYGTAGCSNAKVLDPQAAIESTMSIVTTALSGASLVHDIGIIDNAMTVSLDALVMCDEIIAMAKRFMGGVEVSDETLALDVLEKVGPGGHFVSEDHTLRHFREHYRSKLIDRQNYDAWRETGSLTMVDRIRARVPQIVNAARPAPLPDDVLRELEAIIARAEKTAADKR